MTERFLYTNRFRLAGLLTVALAAAACAPSIDVTTERSDQIGSAANAPVIPPASEIEWSACEAFGIPESVVVETDGWGCATLTAPMDPFDSSADDTVDLALTRHAATGDRRGS